MEKQSILTLILSLFCLASISQSNHCNPCKELPISIQFIAKTFEEMPQEAIELDFEVELLNDTADIFIDTILYKFNGVSSWEVLDNTLAEGEYIAEENQTMTLSLSHNENENPFYLQEIQLYLLVNQKPIRATAYLYWTPWGTLELYNESTINTPFKRWKVAGENANPNRIEINPDTLPEPPDTTSLTCWKTFDGLAYSILVNCDTSDTESAAFENQAAWPWTPVKTFRGRAKGRLLYPYINDEGGSVNIPIANARIEVNSNGIRATGQTDANGYFNIQWNRTMINTSGNVDVKVEMKTANGWVQVSTNPNNVLTWYGAESHDLNHNWNSGSRTDDNFGNLFLPQNSYFHIMHWATKAVQFAQSELSGWSVPWNYLSVKIPTFPYSGGPCHFVGSQDLINLYDPRCLGGESVTMHEVGHYVQYAIQNHQWQPNVGGIHTFVHNNSHPNQTITEGFANAFAMMVDARYHTMDNESFRYNGISAHRPIFIRSNTHPFTNEVAFAQSVFDLWDDIARLSNFGINVNNPIFADDINDLDQGVIHDNLALTFKEICLPFYNNRGSAAGTIQNVLQYYNTLLTGSSCTNKEIKQIADFNFSYNNYNNTNPAGRRFSINSDILAHQINNVSHRNDDLAIVGGIAVPQNPSNYNYNYNSLGDPIEGMNANTGSFNNALNLNSGTNDLSDDLIVSNNSTLFFNNNIPVGWVNNNSPIRPPNPSQLNSTLCGIELVIDDQGEVVIGDGVVDCTAEVLATNDSRVIIRDGGTLTIRNNSKLIIDSDSRIRFEDGASIVLDGPNAVLEVKGRIEIGNNATFTYTGDGYLKTEFYPCLNCDNIIAGTGSKIHLEGSGMSDKILEVADYTHFEPDASITDFALLNGLVEMGKNSVLHVRGAIPNFQYLKVTAIDPNHPFDQIMLNGNPQHTFQNMEISYADKGINDRQIYGGGGLNLSYVDISHCNYGIYTNGSGGRLTNCNITDNAIAGWQMSVGGSGYQSWVKSSTFTDNYFGIHYLSGGSNLYLEHSYFASNILGVYFGGSGSLTGKCSRITNNTVEGISMWNQSTLDFSNNSFMRVENNGSYNIAFNLLRNIYLEDGNNKFLPNNGLMSMSGYIEANSPSLMGTNTIQANNNHWNSSGTSPVSGVDYSLKVQNLQPDTRYINDNNPILFDHQNCIIEVPGPEVFLLGSEDSLESSTTTMRNNNIKINTAHFSNKTIREAILETKSIQSQKKHNGMDVVQKNKHVLELYRQILTEPIDDQNSDLSHLQTYAYGEMKKLFGEVIDSIIYTNKGDTIIIDSLSEKLREVIDTLSMPQYNTGHTYQEKFYYDVERALLYRRIGKINVADSLLTETKKYVASTDSAYLYDLSCRISLENELISNIIDYETYLQGIENCGITNTKSNRKKIISTDESNQKYTFRVFPNPTNGLVKIMSKTFESEAVNLKVYSSTGQLVYSKSFNVIDKESVKTIDLSELTSGIYILNLQSNSFVESEVIVIN